MKIFTKKKSLIILSVVTVVFALDFLIETGRRGKIIPVPETVMTASAIETTLQNELLRVKHKDRIKDSLEAKSACVFDLTQNKIVFEINGAALLPLASLTKLMTAAVATDNLPKNTLVEITPEAVLQEGDTGLIAGERWHSDDLIQIMLIASSNDAAHAIAGSLKSGATNDNTFFIRLMNEKAEEIGLENSYFFNATGLDLSTTEAGAMGTCEDVVKLLAYMLKKYPGLLDRTAKENLLLGERVFKNTNELVQKIPFFLAGKTGFSDLAGGNLMIAVNRDLGCPFAIAVLGSSFDGRFKDIEILYNNLNEMK